VVLSSAVLQHIKTYFLSGDMRWRRREGTDKVGGEMVKMEVEILS